MRGDQRLTKVHSSSNPELGEYNGSVGSYPRIFHVAFSCFPWFCIVLDDRGRLRGLGGVSPRFCIVLDDRGRLRGLGGVSPRFCIVLDDRGRLRGLGGVSPVSA